MSIRVATWNVPFHIFVHNGRDPVEIIGAVSDKEILDDFHVFFWFRANTSLPGGATM